MPSYLDKLSKKLVDLRDERKSLHEERTNLKSHKDAANQHRLALVKKENNQEVNEEEEDAIKEVKENYSNFFDEEVEQSDPEVETSPEYKERKQVAEVIEYLSDELKSNAAATEKVIKE